MLDLTLFPAANFSDTGLDTFSGTKFFRYRFRDFFLVPNFSHTDSETFFPVPNFSDAGSESFFRYQIFPIPPKKWKILEPGIPWRYTLLPSHLVLYWLCDRILGSECIGGIRQASPTSPASFAPHLFATSPQPSARIQGGNTHTQLNANTSLWKHPSCVVSNTHYAMVIRWHILKSLKLNERPLNLSLRRFFKGICLFDFFCRSSSSRHCVFVDLYKDCWFNWSQIFNGWSRMVRCCQMRAAAQQALLISTKRRMRALSSICLFI